ncbi:hypothetical protein [Sediminibacterium sp.]|uniref:hypothetical protein n=1 Tax=Sediminibacterium sp. TaxID=1917865 RepID=UPI003F70527C
MNLFESVICYDFSVGRTQNEKTLIKTNGVHMIGLAWVCNVLSLMGLGIIYLYLSKQSNEIYDFLAMIRYWELAGRIGLIIFLLLVYSMSFGAYGGKVIFLNIIRRFHSMDENEKNLVVTRGGRYFYISLISFFIIAGVVVYLSKYVY